MLKDIHSPSHDSGAQGSGEGSNTGEIFKSTEDDSQKSSPKTKGVDDSNILNELRHFMVNPPNELSQKVESIFGPNNKADAMKQDTNIKNNLLIINENLPESKTLNKSK